MGQELGPIPGATAEETVNRLAELLSGREASMTDQEFVEMIFKYTRRNYLQKIWQDKMALANLISQRKSLKSEKTGSAEMKKKRREMIEEVDANIDDATASIEDAQRRLKNVNELCASGELDTFIKEYYEGIDMQSTIITPSTTQAPEGNTSA